MSRPVDWTGPECPVWEAGSWPGRLLRAGTFAVASVGMAVVAHRLAGGHAPASAVGAAAALLFGLGVLLSRRERRGWQIAVLVTGTQAVLHVGFMAAGMWTAARSGAARQAAWADLLFCHHGGHAPTRAQVSAALSGVDLSHAPLPPPAAAGAAAISTPSVLMLATHLAAAAVMAWWLRRGERAAWAVIRRAVGYLRWIRLPLAAQGETVWVRVLGEVRALTRRGWESGCGVRAPPGSAGAVLPGVA